MFDLERWQEIFDTIRKNKLRTFLTGLSVASGIFILVILLGFGQGMRNGIENEFKQDASTSVWVWPGVTSKEYKGLNPGRRIQLVNENYDKASAMFNDDIEYSSGRIFVRGVSVNYGKEALIYGVQGVGSDFQFIDNAQMAEGRFINYQDEISNGKVAVIGNKIKKDVFGNVETPIGEFIDISGIPFKIVGVFKEMREREEENIFIPISTAQRTFNGGNRINNMSFTLPPVDNFDAAVAQAVNFKDDLKQYLQQTHTVAPDDTGAIEVWSAMEEAKRYYGLTNNIKLFFWFVGVCTIIAGVVGVSNIMMIVVKERTREIGIRKALGAKPWSIIAMILHEAIFVTAISGFGGLIFSMALLELVGPHIEVDYIMNPSVNFNVAFSTVIVLIVAGTLAGFVPAYRAAKVKVIESLRDE
ncbi:MULTISPECIES: ABC transporter permease [Flavobacteriaceae]|jgi:putative ABC transport system permease protein|uniref:ABC transporter permease n=1 Tax=Flagellimonas sp. MMG031 TaxID=3158549 RepID=A0AAU7N164_9FLAO|nr:MULTISPECIES: ABC transporter permease [unclassified Allomuricauda]MBO6533356.1 ABC transporter permease [Allomuricauda sp.]MBO6589871.1 ABC transporter permease [Allomuricauda sp.]MBO6619497.1 ABC transporter permease [Allomuricauda sp.]MBO6645534.1 ABC transporter permease [Allomuricauda sp.]MBO6747741.1 ABC transporter permease [Allomuricauda sp.]